MLKLTSYICNYPQVHSNGYISFGTPVNIAAAITFPIGAFQIVAPYLTTIDLTVKGSVRYSIITQAHPTLSCWLNLTSDYIRSREGVQFEASWMLVARWVDVCPFGNNNCTQVSRMLIELVCITYEICDTTHVQENSFQAVVVTNGVQSYTVFTYQCGELNWVQLNSSSIGFSAGFTLFANHPLSRQPNVNDIACLNQQCPPWTNVVYQISERQTGTLHVTELYCILDDLYMLLLVLRIMCS